jgi:hypothetical protein
VQQRRRRRIVIGIVLMVVGGLVGAVGIGGAVATGARAVTGGHEVQVPGVDRRHLDAGEYRIYVHDGELSTASVSCDDGERPVVEEQGDLSETITRGSRQFDAQAQFTLDHGSRCDVVLAGDGTAIVTSSVVSTVKRAGSWALLAVPGGLLVVLGFLVLLIGLLAKPQAADVPLAAPAWGSPPPPPAPLAPPPPAPAMPQGWYPDPGGSGRQRWGDGQRWTEPVS